MITVTQLKYILIEIYITNVYVEFDLYRLSA